MKKFRDFSISRKLPIGFLVMILLILAVGGIGTFGMIHINSVNTYLYEKQTVPIDSLIRAYEAIYQSRVDVGEATIESNDPSKVGEYNESYENNMQTFLDNMEIYRLAITTQTSLGLVDTIEKLLNKPYIPAVEKAFELAQAGNRQTAAAALHSATDDTTTLFQNMKQLVENRMTSAKSISDSNGQSTIVLTIILTIFVVLGAVTGGLLGLRISRVITKPIERIVDVTGSITLSRVDVDLGDLNSKDETGRLTAVFTKMLEGIRKQVIAAEVISKGNLTQTVPLRSREDALGLALERIKNDLSNTLQMISMAADQVNTGSEQISSAAQALSSGATEQAASVEELNASIVSIAQQTSHNVVSVSNATNYVEQVVKGMSDSHEYMQRLDGAMHKIRKDSQQISKITKLVEDITFQTNILTLSAAVETARAGSAGKGLAVVADEVHNLAAKSAKAAKQTASLTRESVTTVSEGERLAAETLKALDEMSEKAQTVDQTIRETEAASSAQAVTIGQTNRGLSQVSAMVQSSTATTKESSASSEGLAAQAQTLQEEMSKFKLAGAQNHTSFDTQKRRQTKVAEAEPQFSF